MSFNNSIDQWINKSINRTTNQSIYPAHLVWPIGAFIAAVKFHHGRKLISTVPVFAIFKVMWSFMVSTNTLGVPIFINAISATKATQALIYVFSITIWTKSPRCIIESLKVHG